MHRASADSTVQTLPFSQDWTNTALINVDNNWSGVPGIEGFRGTGLVNNVGFDPRTVLAPDTSAPHVAANRVDLTTITALNLGVVELEAANPVVALQPAAGVRAPNLRINISTLGRSGVVVSYNVRDLDASVDNALQQVALHYRVGSSPDCTGLIGNFTNIEGGYINDATTGPGQATLVTPVSVTLPEDANNQPCVQLRIMTTDYGVAMPPPGTTNNDEWIGIDDIRIESSPLPTDRAINAIQGSGATSPFVGERVRTTGIVTGLRTGDLGFYMQAPDSEAEAEADPQTSEGLLVRPVPGGPMLERGDLVEVTGVVSELPLSNPEGRRVTQISGGQVQIISRGNPLPAPITLTPADTPTDGPLDALERYEGMRVRVASLLVVGPTEGTLDEANAVATSSGVFFGVIDDGSAARTMREPGLDPFEPEPPGLPSCLPPSPCVPRFDGNPERIRVDSDELVGATTLDLAAGQSVSGLVGPLSYDLNAYSIAVDPDASLRTSDQPTAAAVADPRASQFTVASLNLQRLYDTADDPGTIDVVMTDAALERRLNKLSLLVRNVLRTPDILGVSEAENADVLQALADRINFDAIAAGQASPTYLAYLVEGRDPGGLDVGFLVRSTRMQVRDVTQGEVGTFVDPTDGSIDPLNDRPSLILRAGFTGADGAAFPITVIANHLQSLDGISDPAAGPRVREKRRAQAEFLANLVQARQIGDPNERIVVLGDMNAFQFNDGLVDSIGTIMGLPTPPSAVLLASPDLIDPDLVDSGSSVPPDQRYSFVFDGNAQQLDHILFTQNLAGAFGSLQFGRANADFPEVLRNDPARAERASDHDALVAYFTPPASLSIDDVSVTEGDHGVRQARFTVTLQGPQGHDVTVRFRTEAGDPPDGAAAGIDYVTNEGTLTFGPGMTTQKIVVDVIGDRLVEADELFTVQLSDPSPNAIIERAAGTGTILNDDALPVVTIEDTSVGEGDKFARVRVKLPAPATQVITVRFATADGTATDGVGEPHADYVAAAGTIVFNPGDVRQTIEVCLQKDRRDEPSETFFVDLTDATNATIEDGRAIVTIRDNDRRPRIRIRNPSADEPATGAAPMTFRVTLSAPSGRTVTADFRTADLTADAGKDYVARTGTLTFEPGETEKTIGITILADDKKEQRELFVVRLRDLVNATAFDTVGIGTIDDARHARPRGGRP